MQKTMSRWYFVAFLLMAAAVLPTRVSAFWPFSSNNGKVMGVETNAANTNGLLQKVNQMRGTQKTETTDDANFNSDNYKGLSTTANPKARLEQAVKSGKLTQAQANEILTRLNAIKAKQQELVTMQQSFAEWLRTNNVSTAVLNESIEPKREITGTPKPLIKRTEGDGLRK